MKIVWTKRARDDLANKAAWIARERPRAAAAWLAGIEEAVGQLPRFPFRGRHLPEFPKEPARELIVSPYRIVYLTSPDCVTILTVKHSRQKMRKQDLRVA